MIDQAALSDFNDPTWIILKDDEGLYVTLRARLDDRLADPYRNASVPWKQAFLQSKLEATVVA